MTKHCISNSTSETTAEFFTRVAREKPKTLVPCKGCHYCGGDHRGPIEYWPAEETRIHLEAVRKTLTPTELIGKGGRNAL